MYTKHVHEVAIGLCVVVALLGAVSAGLPAGYTTFFEGQACPEGWSQIPEAQGRLIVSVVDASTNGLTVGNALADKEDRMHTHPFTGSATLPSKHVAAVGCCNDEAAGHGTYEATPGVSNGSTSGLPFTQMLLCRLDKPAPLTVPFGGVAYFDSTVETCPPSWSPYELSEGRALVPGYAAVEGPTKSLAAPLTSQERRNHSHTYSTTVITDNVSFAGVDGCCNDSPAADGTYTTTGTAEEAPSDIPYMQMLTCVNMNETFDVALPPNALLWSPMVGCPKGWQLSSTVSGRFLVALPEKGEPGASFGGTSLGPNSQTEPPHSHALDGQLPVMSTGVGLASGCCAGGYAGADTYDFHADTTGDDVEIPWLMVTLCEQIAS